MQTATEMAKRLLQCEQHHQLLMLQEPDLVVDPDSSGDDDDAADQQLVVDAHNEPPIDLVPPGDHLPLCSTLSQAQGTHSAFAAGRP